MNEALNQCESKVSGLNDIVDRLIAIEEINDIDKQLVQNIESKLDGYFELIVRTHFYH